MLLNNENYDSSFFFVDLKNPINTVNLRMTLVFRAVIFSCSILIRSLDFVTLHKP